MKLAHPRALLFDWDNTLVDSWQVIRHALNVTLEAMGHEPWTLDEVRTRVRASARDTFPQLFGERSEEATKIFYDTFEADHLKQIREREGAGEMLRTLAAEGYYLGVVSNKVGYLLRAEAVHLGWDGLFGQLVGATDAPRDKPAIEPVELALSGSGASRGPQVWFVGDTDIDMRCAVNAGCAPILVREEAPGPGEFGDAQPLRHVVACLDLVELVRNT